MRRAMAEAVVGDDVFGEDPTVRELEEEVARLFHREASLFVPSGSMGNQIAAVASGTPLPAYGAVADSIMVSLSKGLGAPIGSVLIGDRAFVGKARDVRKMFGGGMRQVGVIAAPGLVAVRTMRARLADDHRR